MKTKLLFSVFLLASIIFIGCSTNESNDSDSNSKTITNDDVALSSELDASVDDISIIVEDQFSLQQSISRTRVTAKSATSLCATIKTSLINKIYTKTIDYGTEGCVLPNGNRVKGKIIISFSDIFSTPSRTISYTLVAFYHNDKLIEGNKTITHELKSTNLLATIHPVSTHSIDMKITYPDGKVYSRIGSRVREMTQGFNTLYDWNDNVFMILGYNTTTFPNGQKYTFTITTPLQIDMSCTTPFPVEGVIQVTKNDAEATLDYGNGDCDTKVSMSFNGTSKQIELKN